MPEPLSNEEGCFWSLGRAMFGAVVLLGIASRHRDVPWIRDWIYEPGVAVITSPIVGRAFVVAALAGLSIWIATKIGELAIPDRAARMSGAFMNDSHTFSHPEKDAAGEPVQGASETASQVSAPFYGANSDHPSPKRSRPANAERFMGFNDPRWFDRIVVPATVLDLALTILSVLLGLMGLAMFEMPDDEPFTPLDAIGLVAFLLLVPAYFVACYGVLRQRRWGRWAYLAVIATSCLLSLLMGLWTATPAWDFAGAVHSLAQIACGAVLLALFGEELFGLFDSMLPGGAPETALASAPDTDEATVAQP